MLVTRAGAKLAAERPEWKMLGAAAADEEITALLRSLGLPSAARLVGLHLGAAGGSAKRWLPERFGKLASRLSGSGLTPLLLGAAEDAPIAAEASLAAGIALASAVGRDRPGLLPALLPRLACLVSGDTGVAHLAAALGVPTVTLFGPTDARLSAPRAATARVIDQQVPCAPCFLSDCPIDHICMGQITPQEVAQQVLEAVRR